MKSLKVLVAIATLLVLTAIGPEAYSQNLQFSQVLFLDTHSSGLDSLGAVPAGKVWKITASGTEYTSYNSCAFSFDNGQNAAFRVGGVNTYNSGYTQVNSFDEIWIPAGTPVHAMGCGGYRWLSIIEFSITP